MKKNENKKQNAALSPGLNRFQTVSFPADLRIVNPTTPSQRPILFFYDDRVKRIFAKR